MSDPGHDESSADELDPDEPRTPLWLPLLGLCLFVSVLVYALHAALPLRLRTDVVLVPAGTSRIAARCQVEADAQPSISS